MFEVGLQTLHFKHFKHGGVDNPFLVFLQIGGYAILSDMGLLENYKEQNPEAFREAPKWRPPQEYGFFIRLVMRLSGGRVRDINQASYVLLIAAAIVALLSLLFWFGVL